MKKKLGGLVLTLGALVISAACATSGASSKTKEPQPEPEAGANWAKSAPSVAGRPANAAAIPAARLASTSR
jgi:hypothetical protein